MRALSQWTRRLAARGRASPRCAAEVLLTKLSCGLAINPSSVEALGSHCRSARLLSVCDALPCWKIGSNSVGTAAALARVRPDSPRRGTTRPVSRSESHRDLVRAPTCGPQTQRVWSVLLHPLERESPSETVACSTKAFSSTVRVSRDSLFFRTSPTGTNSARHTCNCGHTSGIKPFATWSETLGPPSLYTLRLSGATHEVVTSARYLLVIKKWRRWLSDRSVSRCEEGGRINEQLARLSQNMEKHAHVSLLACLAPRLPVEELTPVSACSRGDTDLTKTILWWWSK